ncbi:MAG: hypothetical protein LBG73_10195 [Spirochaetaceae bacterium]|jgi:hypothetical protein|nr:hypothetical protein [Spirochaetaceae bacterium]
MGRTKYPTDGITIPEKIQVKLTEAEREEFFGAWKELEPDLEWASFCRKMLKNGIKQVREDQRLLKEYKEKLGKLP